MTIKVLARSLTWGEMRKEGKGREERGAAGREGKGAWEGRRGGTQDCKEFESDLT